MKALVLRLDAPMMSFGDVLVDQHGFIERFPGQAMLTGLVANALGWRHGEFDRLHGLQERLWYAARWDVRPERMIDYHTVDLGQPKMRGDGWTTRGSPEHRKGGDSARTGTHERYRHYWVDGLMTVVLGLIGKGEPGLDAVERAFRQPVRPLFLGRKTCLPARPLLDPEVPVLEGSTPLEILRRVPRWDRDGRRIPSGHMEACWPADAADEGKGEERFVYDLRDWSNQLPAGSRLRKEGVIGEERGA